MLYLVPQVCGTEPGAAPHAEALDRLSRAGFTEATLWVLHSNRRARRFYAKHGWRADGGVKQEQRNELVTTEVRYRRALLMPARARGGGNDRMDPHQTKCCRRTGMAHTGVRGSTPGSWTGWLTSPRSHRRLPRPPSQVAAVSPSEGSAPPSSN